MSLRMAGRSQLAVSKCSPHHEARKMLERPEIEAIVLGYEELKDERRDNIIYLQNARLVRS